MTYAKVLDASPWVAMANVLGTFQMRTYLVRRGGATPTVVALSTRAGVDDDALVRLNSACLTGEVFGCDRCDCSWQLWESLRLMKEDGNGVLIYLPDHDGRGAGSHAKAMTYAEQDRHNVSTAEAFDRLGLGRDSRSYEHAVAVLAYEGVRDVRLLTNNPDKVACVTAAGISVTTRSLVCQDARVYDYLVAKQAAFGHWIECLPEGSTAHMNVGSARLIDLKTELPE